jgi:hypothetical protein
MLSNVNAVCVLGASSPVTVREYVEPNNTPHLSTFYLPISYFITETLRKMTCTVVQVRRVIMGQPCQSQN